MRVGVPSRAQTNASTAPAPSSTHRCPRAASQGYRHGAMQEMQMTRSPDDRRLYALGDLGTLRYQGWTSRAATAEAGPQSWELKRVGVFRQTIEATDGAGTVVGSFSGRVLKTGGTLTWAGRELALASDSFWKQRYALLDGDHQLATIEARIWGKKAGDVSVDDPATIDPGLLLFAIFVVRCLAEDAASSA